MSSGCRGLTENILFLARGLHSPRYHAIAATNRVSFGAIIEGGISGGHPVLSYLSGIQKIGIDEMVLDYLTYCTGYIKQSILSIDTDFGFLDKRNKKNVRNTGCSKKLKIIIKGRYGVP